MKEKGEAERLSAEYEKAQRGAVSAREAWEKAERELAGLMGASILTDERKAALVLAQEAADAAFKVSLAKNAAKAEALYKWFIAETEA